MRIRRILALGILLCMLVGCAGPVQETTRPGTTAALASTATASTGATVSQGTTAVTQPSSTQRPSAAQTLLEQMTLEDKVAQLFIVAMRSNLVMKYFLKDYPVGGVIFFGKDIKTPDQLRSSVQLLRENSRIPLLLSVDEEGGRVVRIGSNSAFAVPKVGTALSVGSTGDPENARNMGSTIGSYLKEFDFNLNFAPVADIYTNPANTVIGDRAFGSDPQVVAKMVSAAVEGMQAQGIMTCIKHFPGHGDTRGDTHDGFVAVDKTWEQLLACEIIPFAAALPKTDIVMVAHISTPNVTSDGLPSSLSCEMITGKLRGELGYEGLVITDSMGMGAITEAYSSAEAAVLALQAGVDILLMPEDFRAAYQGVLDAVADGRLTTARIDESVLRILMLKEKYGMV